MTLMRRTSGILAAATLALGGSLLAASPASAAPVSVEIDGITYEADDAAVSDGAVVTAFDGSTSTVAIPDSVTIAGGPYDVVAIDDEVFRSESLTGATIGDNVVSIGDNAFRDNELQTLSLGSSVSVLGHNAFFANDLTSLDIPASLTTIRGFQFNDLATLDIPNTVTKIDAAAFTGNPLTHVVLPESITQIGQLAFGRNADLLSVEFTGPAPTSVFGEGTFGSFDTASGQLVLIYPWRFDASQVSGGYTSPEWETYATQALATVDFDLNGHGTTTPGAQDVVVGENAAAPASEPSAVGYEFTGWFTGAGADVEFNFGDAIEGDITVYAGWDRVETSGNGDDNGDTDSDVSDGVADDGAGTDGGVVDADALLPDTGGAPLGLLLMAGLSLTAGSAVLLRRRVG